MAFYESPVFPESIAMGAQGGPEWSTSVVASVGGAEDRNSNWPYPRHRWDVGHGINAQTEYEDVRAHFLVMRGRLHGFRFKDWSDYQATQAQGVVQGLTSTTFQLLKRYTRGALTMDRRIRKPRSTGFVLRDGATTLATPADYTLDTTTGVVTTTTSRTAADLSWSGQFDVPMRYDTDRWDAAIVGRTASKGLLYQVSLPIVEDMRA